MELPTCGSLMYMLVIMTTKILLPPDLLKILPSVMWRRFFMSCPLPCCHSFPTLGNNMVIQTIKTTWFSMPKVLFIINNLLVIKRKIRISQPFIPCFVFYSVNLARRSCCISSSTMLTVTRKMWCVFSILFPWWFQKWLGLFAWINPCFCYLRTLSFNISQSFKSRSLYNLQWLSHSLAINTKSSSFMPHLGKESHASF